MPARKKGPNEVTEAASAQGASAQLERITRLLGLLAVKGESQADKIKVLSAVGFTNTEIAELLGVSANAVNVSLHRLRSKR